MRKLVRELRRAATFALVLTAGAALIRVVRERRSGPAVGQPKPWPDWYRRLVRQSNTIAYRLGMVGGSRSILASVEYVGRKSGTVRRTPVWARVTGDLVVVGLPTVEM